MKSTIVLSITALLASLFLSTRSFAQTGPQAGDRSPIYCADEAKSICAQLNFLSNINSSDEGSFVAHITTPSNQPVNNLKLDLWMNMGHHGHGSSPVDIADQGNNDFKITNAWFVMSGTWLVRIDFDFNGTHQHIEIPVFAAE